MMEGTAGDRWETFYRTCRLIIDNERLFDKREIDFAESTQERLDKYKADTYLSTRQIKWLVDLEEKVKHHGL
jgi:hypothetical protein